ncbi:MAG TPA: hypothetical protein VFU05_08155 [Cyclobacteriaceae bacterium]|nr:hypothetical protein [Cyclobacteriaceae bacterium]
MKRLVAIVCFSFFILQAYSQATTRRFPASINNSSINITAPFISLDGSTLLFTSDYADDGTLVYFSQRDAGDWKVPVELPKQFNAKTNFSKGYTLSADGKILYLSSIKSGGVGGYDMWSCDIRGGELKNLYLPVNTKSHEGCPTFTTDGNTMYFMRCEKMERDKADKCKIMVSRKKQTGQWEEPTELPASINTGNSQTPRIMADGETLIFSSNKITPNKGGMDLYVTKFKDGSWSNPLPMDFVNTAKDDQFVSAQANGRYLVMEAPGKFKSEVVEFLIPDDLRPKGVMKVDGMVKDINGAPTAAYLSVTDLFNNKRIFSGQPAADGSFFFYLTEGGAYELSVDHAESSYTYYSKQYDLMANTLLRNDKLNIVLKKLNAGDELDLDALRFKPETYELDHATSELRRLSRLLKNSPGLIFEIQVLLAGYVEDSVKSSPDLTEVVVDSTNVILEAIDSTGQMITRDSLVIKTTYHNDRTEKQANAIIDQLVALGTDRKNLSLFVNSRPEEVIENRKTSVRLLARKKK